MQIELPSPLPLTDWANEPSVRVLKEDLDTSKYYHDQQVNKIKHWRDVLSPSYSAEEKKDRSRSHIKPKIVRRQAEWRYSSLSEPFLNTSRVFAVYPRTYEDEESARQNEIVLNYQFDTKLNKVKFIDELVKTVVDEGTAIVRVGWERNSHIDTKEVIDYECTVPDETDIEQVEEQIKQYIDFETSNPRMYLDAPEELKKACESYKKDNIPLVYYAVSSHLEEIEKMDDNKPVVSILPPENVYIDPSCQGELDKAMYVIYSFETSRSELLKAGLYSNLESINWDDLSLTTDEYHTNSNDDTVTANTMHDSTRRRVVAYEYWGYWDINNTGELTPIVATWVGNTMIRLAINPYPDNKLPFVVIPYLPVKRSIYGETDSELLEDNQNVYGAITRMMLDLMGKSANSQQGFAKGMLDAVNKRKFDEGRDYEFNPSVPPQQGYIMHAFPEIPQSAFAMLQDQSNEAESITGVKGFNTGVNGDTYGQVAVGIRSALDAASKREMAILRRISKGITDIGSKIMAMNSVFLSDEEWIRISNKNYVKISREQLEGNFDCVVDIHTAEVDNQTAQDLAFMLQTIGPSVSDPTFSAKIMAKICDLKRIPDSAEWLRNWEPQPDPLEEQKKQLEIQLLQAQIAQYQAQANRNNAEAQATQLDSQLDATGVKHERDLELQQAQGQANQDLQIIKTLGTPLKQGEQAPNIDAMIGYNLQKNALKAHANTVLPRQNPTLRSNIR